MEEVFYRLEIEPLDLGEGIKGVSLELVDRETGEPPAGDDAARIWAAVVRAVAGNASWVLDFFAHLDRVREFCEGHGIIFREPAAVGRTLLIPSPPEEHLEALIQRFAGEMFGARAGGPLPGSDPEVEGSLSSHGVDAYQPVIDSYLFCAACDFEKGFLTLLTSQLWATEVIRRVRPALEDLPVAVARGESPWLN
jgi:hypothetical protein